MSVPLSVVQFFLEKSSDTEEDLNLARDFEATKNQQQQFSHLDTSKAKLLDIRNLTKPATLEVLLPVQYCTFSLAILFVVYLLYLCFYLPNFGKDQTISSGGDGLLAVMVSKQSIFKSKNHNKTGQSGKTSKTSNTSKPTKTTKKTSLR